MHMLLSQTKDLVKKEKHFTYLILNNLKQIEETKLYCDLGYSSLHAYLEKELGYSSAESALRVANVKLMNKSVLVQEKIKSGDLNLTQGGSLFQALAKSEVSDKPEKIKEALSQIAGKGTRESEKIIHDIFETKAKLPKKIILNKRLQEKLERLKKIYGEKSFEEMIEIVVDEKLMELATPSKKVSSRKKWIEKKSFKKDPSEHSSSRTRRNNKMSLNKLSSSIKDLDKSSIIEELLNQQELPFMKEVEKPKSRYIPISLRRAIIVRAQKCCEYVSPTGVHCKERRNLEFEHSRPYSHGGGHTFKNLNLYCRSHNQRQGILKIEGYLDKRGIHKS